MTWVFGSGMAVTVDGWLSMRKELLLYIGKTLAEPPSAPHYHIWKRYYEDKSSQDLKKMIVTLEGNGSNITPAHTVKLSVIYRGLQ